ncbi:sulfite exporter TauE/SafE family protein [Jiangella rhizosphaerae]|uniref:Probable membrane transporter protein n=1 Tax=Jiangella rhizosphaerae TaxID=2293569 RepID=A0A418KUE2_9ACTN|nr:sulfite exporter TauE/SafE family protein [Jiangella rhizosphaerae]RIQ31238.1 sulfite exporter TauE/SafE family protein [Jiangella rhizosphaerae]
MPPVEVVVVLAAAVFLGAAVQGTIGLGLGLLAAPAAALLAPELVPGTLLWLSLLLPVFTLAREWSDVDWWGLRWAFLGRLPATLLGAWIVSVSSPRVLSVTVGVVILVAVALTARTIRLPMTRGVLVAAGTVSGISGTATSIGGPPLALVYQSELGPRVRSTLAVYFLVGVGVSLAALGVVGELTMVQTTTALWLAPPLVAGFAAASGLRTFVDGGRLRLAVMVVCTLSGATLIVRSLAG